MLEKLKNIINDKMYWIILLITMIFLGLYIKIQYATDTYQIFTIDSLKPFNHFLLSGRFITASFWGICILMLNLGIYKTYIISFFIAIFSISLAIYKLYNIINWELKNNIISLILSLMIVLNAFIIELFLFYEKGVMALAILLSIIASENVIKYYKNGEKKHLIISLISLMIATFSYQGVIGIFVAILVIFAIRYSKNILEFIKNNIIIVFLYGICGITNVLLAKFIFSNPRLKDTSYNFLESLEKIISNSKNMIIDSYGILPSNFFALITIVTIIVFIVALFLRKSNIKENVISVLKLIYIIVAILLCSLAPQILMDSNNIWLVARSTYPFASIIGIIMLFILMDIRNNKLIKNIIITISIIFLIIQYCGFIRITMDHYILNYNDINRAKQIRNEINKYEINNKKIVDNVVIYYDKYISYSYNNLKFYGDTNVSAFVPDWSVEGILNFNYEKKLNISVEKNEEIERNFKEKDWDSFNNDQLIFEDNTLHLCIF